MQTKLNVEADGKMGPATQKALKDFQSSKGMNASGELDAKTLSALGVDSAAGGASPAKSEKKAEGSAAAGASSPASGSTTEQKPQQAPAPAKADTKPGEKKQ